MNNPYSLPQAGGGEEQEIPMRIALAGAGAFGEKHLDGLKNIDGVEITSIISRRAEQAAEVASRYGAKHSGTELSEALERDDVDAVILCTPTQMHAEQAVACMEAGKHVQVEIPLSDTWNDAEAVLAKQEETGLVCMVGHTRRFNPSHQFVHNRIQLLAENGAICTLSLSFNNDGPLGTFFRYIGDTATYIARYDDLVTGKEEPIDLTGVTVSNNGIELQDREFIAAIREGREPNSSVASVIDCYRVIGDLAASLEAQDGWS